MHYVRFTSCEYCRVIKCRGVGRVVILVWPLVDVET